MVPLPFPPQPDRCCVLTRASGCPTRTQVGGPWITREPNWTAPDWTCFYDDEKPPPDADEEGELAATKPKKTGRVSARKQKQKEAKKAAKEAKKAAAKRAAAEAAAAGAAPEDASHHPSLSPLPGTEEEVAAARKAAEEAAAAVAAEEAAAEEEAARKEAEDRALTPVQVAEVVSELRPLTPSSVSPKPILVVQGPEDEGPPSQGLRKGDPTVPQPVTARTAKNAPKPTPTKTTATSVPAAKATKASPSTRPTVVTMAEPPPAEPTAETPTRKPAAAQAPPPPKATAQKSVLAVQGPGDEGAPTQGPREGDPTIPHPDVAIARNAPKPTPTKTTATSGPAASKPKVALAEPAALPGAQIEVVAVVRDHRSPSPAGESDSTPPDSVVSSPIATLQASISAEVPVTATPLPAAAPLPTPKSPVVAKPSIAKVKPAARTIVADNLDADMSDSSDDSNDESDDEELFDVWGDRVDGDEEKEWKRFLKDYYRVLDMGGRSIIEKGDAGGDGAADLDGGGESGSSEQVLTLMWQHHIVINLIFAYYCGCGSDISQMSLNEWSQFVTDFGIADNKSKYCKKADMDRLFIQVDSKAAHNYQEKVQLLESMSTKHRENILKLEKDRDHELLDAKVGVVDSAHHQGLEVSRAVQGDLRRNAFSRVEFYVALMHIAVNRHLRTGHAKDMKEALLFLLVGDLQTVLDGQGNIPAKVFAPPEQFREAHCYSKTVTFILSRQLTPLRSLFKVLCRAKESSHMHLLNMDEWMDFLRNIDLFSGALTEREATFCFTWSRSIVEDETTSRGYIKDTCIPFEGFMEALCRLSVLTALPTDDELAEAGYSDGDEEYLLGSSPAGAYLYHLRLDHEDQYLQLIKVEDTDWGDEPQRQPIERRMAHLLSVIWYALARQRQAASGYGSLLTKDCAGSAPEVLEALDSLLH